MIEKPMDVLEEYPVRKGRKQKRAFQNAVQAYLNGLGYETALEKGPFGVQNIVIGDPQKATYLFTAHYDTCARLPFPNFITPCSLGFYLLYQLVIVAAFLIVAVMAGVAAGVFIKNGLIAGYVGFLIYWVLLVLMLFGPANKHNANDNTSGVVAVLELAKSLPEQYRDLVCFVLFDLEEAGLFGSSAYQQKHKKETKNQIVFNFDCVGDGDEILLFPTGKLKKDQVKMLNLAKLNGGDGDKTITVREKGISIYPSDQSNFPYGVGIAAFNRSRWIGLYLGRIHTHRDTVLDENNITVLKDGMLRYITQ